MKTTMTHFRMALLLVALWLIVPLTTPADAATPAADNSNTNQIKAVSVFVDDPHFGKDPFFPNSKRRLSNNVKKRPANQPPKEVTQAMAYQQLELKGVSLGSNGKLAIINNYTLAEGETRDIKIENRRVKIKCNRIEESEVFITVDGKVNMRLKLRKGL